MDREDLTLLKVFGARLADLRKLRGFTQQELSTRAAVSAAAIASIETGRRWPQLETLHKLTSSLDMTLYDFFSAVEWPEGYN